MAEKCNNKRVTRLRTEIRAHALVAAQLYMEAQGGALNGKHKVVRVRPFLLLPRFHVLHSAAGQILGKHLAERADPVDGTRPPQQHL